MKTATRVTLLLLALLMSISFVACADVEETGVWENATYTSDKTFGKGEKTVTVKITAEEQTLTFTIKTDKAFLGEALAEHDLIEGKEGAYGIFMTSVNGITVSEADRTYWALYKDGVYSMTGVDTTPIADGEHYELVKESY